MQALFILTLLATIESRASEAFFVPPAGTGAAVVSGGYRAATRDFGDETGTAKLRGLERLGVSYDYTFDDLYSFGAQLSYTDLGEKYPSENTAYTRSGLEPLILRAQGRSAVGGGRLLSAATLAIGLDNGTLNSLGSVNRVVGDPIDGFNNALTLTPRLGFEGDLRNFTLGVLARYDVIKLPTTLVVSLNRGHIRGKLDGNNQFGLRAFGEYHLERYRLGLSLEWIKFEIFKLRLADERAAAGGYTLLHADLYARIPVVDDLVFLPTITWYTTALADTSENYDDLRINLALRKTF